MGIGIRICIRNTDCSLRKVCVAPPYSCMNVILPFFIDCYAAADKVRADKDLLYELLSHLLELDDSAATSLPSRRPPAAADDKNKRRGNHSSCSAAATYPPALYEELLELMCTREPGRVVHYLRAHSNDHNNAAAAAYRAEEALALCRKHGILDAQVHLLEVAGRYGEGFNLLCGDLEVRVNTYLHHLQAQVILLFTLKGRYLPYCTSRTS